MGRALTADHTEYADSEIALSVFLVCVFGVFCGPSFPPPFSQFPPVEHQGAGEGTLRIMNAESADIGAHRRIPGRSRIVVNGRVKSHGEGSSPCWAMGCRTITVNQSQSK